MSAPRLELDFVRPGLRLTPLGAALLATGLLVLALGGLEYQAMTARRAGLELRLAEARRHLQHEHRSGPQGAHLGEAVAHVATELGTPWTLLLAELEQASADSKDVAVLAIEPDHDKHRVHVSGEARSLPVALAYVQKLQGTRSVRYPMLDSHEVRADDSEHPVRFTLTGEWREGT